jgi:hypothetical protein
MNTHCLPSITASAGGIGAFKDALELAMGSAT